MSKVDGEWFRDKIRQRGMTQRAFGDKLEMDPSSVSLMLKGERAMPVERAARIASILGVTLDEVVQRAGVKESKLPGDKIGIVGYLDGAASTVILPEHAGHTRSPGNLPQGSVAFVLRTTGTALDMMNGWVAFAGPVDADANDYVDKTAIVKARGYERPMMRLIRRGAAPGLFTLTGIAQEPIHDVEIEWVRPVALFRPL